MPNHFHLLLRTGKEPLSQSMRKLLTGYVVNLTVDINGMDISFRTDTNPLSAKMIPIS